METRKTILITKIIPFLLLLTFDAGCSKSGNKNGNAGTQSLEGAPLAKAQTPSETIPEASPQPEAVSPPPAPRTEPITLIPKPTPEPSPSASPDAVVTPIPVELQEPDYLSSSKYSDYGLVEAQTISPRYLRELRARTQGSELVRLRVGKLDAVSVYWLKGYEFKNAVVFQPKIFVSSSLTGGRPRIIEGPDATASMTVALAFVDGMTPNLSTPFGPREVPSQYRINDLAGIKDQLYKIMGGAPLILGFNRCPVKLALQMEAQTKISIVLPPGLTTCPINTFIPATIRASKDVLRRLLEDSITRGVPEISAKWDLSTPIAVKAVSAHIKNEPMEKRLDAVWKRGGTVLATEAVEQIDLLAREVFKDLDLTPSQLLLNDLSTQVIKQDFSELPRAQCPNGVRCFKRNAVGTGRDFDLNDIDNEYFGPEMPIAARAALYEIISEKSAIMLKRDDRNFFDPPVGELNNTLRMVSEGDLIEINLEKFLKTEIRTPEPVVRFEPNKSCVETFMQCTNGGWICINKGTEPDNCRTAYETVGRCDRCTDVIAPGANCHVFGCDPIALACTKQCGGTRCDACAREQKGITICDQVPLCLRLSKSPPPKPVPYRVNPTPIMTADFVWVCSRFEEVCARYEEHWERFTQFAEPALGVTSVERPLMELDLTQIVGGLDLRFLSSGPNKRYDVTCPMLKFDWHFSGTRLFARIQNVAGCPDIFNQDNRREGYAPTLSIINRISMPERFRCGSLTETYRGEMFNVCVLPDGSREESHEPIWKSYFPRVELQGSIRVLGAYFESELEE
ncbi:hypothetical protein WDW86_10135 [Bdellovibrionota bacterium FG-2]